MDKGVLMNRDYHPDGPNLSNLSVPKEDNEWWRTDLKP
jgi:hypothetical protein